MPPLEKYDEFISKYYYKLKKDFKENIWDDKLGVENEDIFHDTLIKCKEHLENISSNEERLKYLYKSLSQNIIREYKYARRRCRGDVECLNKLDGGDDIDEIEIDIELAYDAIKKRYGEITAELLMKFCEGWEENRLNIEYKINNSAYIIRKSFNFLKEYYGTFHTNN